MLVVVSWVEGTVDLLGRGFNFNGRAYGDGESTMNGYELIGFAVYCLFMGFIVYIMFK